MRRRHFLWSISAAAFSGAAAEAPLWLDVPFVRQETNGCGAAVVAMVMRYWQHAADPAAIQQELYSPAARGAYASDMERYLGKHGFRTAALTATWQDLAEHVAKGRPLIVALEVGRKDLHYVVVAGIDQARAIILTNDPARRKLRMEHRAVFEKRWKGAANWTLLAVPEASSSAGSY